MKPKRPESADFKLEIEEIFDKKAVDKFERETGVFKLQTYITSKFEQLLFPFRSR